MNSVSMSRDSLPLATRNFNLLDKNTLAKGQEATESQVNLVLSDCKSVHSDEKHDSKRQEYRYDPYEEDREVISKTHDNNEYKNLNFGGTNRSYIKHATADLQDNSNDYSEDMDESVAFSKGLSDKENRAIQKKFSARVAKNHFNTLSSCVEDDGIVNAKASPVIWNNNHVKPSSTMNKKKAMKSSRGEQAAKSHHLNYSSNVKAKQKGFQVQFPDKRRAQAS